MPTSRRSRLDNTLLGATLKLSARLEGATCKVRNCLVFNQGIYQLLSDRSRALPLAKFGLKGRAEPVIVHGSRLPEARLHFAGENLRDLLAGRPPSPWLRAFPVPQH